MVYAFIVKTLIVIKAYAPAEILTADEWIVLIFVPNAVVIVKFPEPPLYKPIKYCPLTIIPDNDNAEIVFVVPVKLILELR